CWSSQAGGHSLNHHQFAWERSGTMSKVKKATSNRSTTRRRATAVRRKAEAPAAGSATAWARHLIEFGAQDASTYAPHTLPMSELAQASARSPIPWPSGKEPAPAPLARKPAPADPLPAADYLIVTWTVEEARCLADTLTPGYPSKTAWYD